MPNRSLPFSIPWILLLSVCVIAQGSGKTYSDKTNGFSVRYPADFKVAVGKKAETVHYFGDPGKGTKLIKAYPPVKSGDRLTALYVPGKPVAFFYNGAPTGSIDNSYAKVFFGLWLLPNTSSPDLRKDLLRLK